MKAFAVLALATVAKAAVIAPYAGLAGLPYAGLTGLTGYAGLPYAAGYLGGAPLATAAIAPYTVAAAAPAIAAAPLPTPSSQFQTQDEFGNLAYGYSNINSAKQERGNAYGGVTGSYSYVDANGIVQTTNYIADGLGFRVVASNLPVGPVADLKQPVFDLVGPAPVVDTPEVAAAKAEFQKAFDEAAGREKRSAQLPLATTYGLPLNYGYGLGLNTLPLGYSGLNYGYGLGLAAPYAAPIAAAPAAIVKSAPAAREAVLTKIKLNPGHAVAYRVD